MEAIMCFLTCKSVKQNWWDSLVKIFLINWFKVLLPKYLNPPPPP